MLVLKSLQFQNIGRFIEPQTIDFTTLGSLVQIDAINTNGGSSGSGKSTVLKSLEFLLGLNDVSNGILQSRLTKESMIVTGLFDFNGISLKVERGKKLLIELDGEVTTGSSKLTEEKLDQILGMSRDLFCKILIKRQNEGGFFLDLGATETHKFLTSCLGLDLEQSKILTLDSRLDVLDGDHKSALYDLMTFKAFLDATQSALSSLGIAPVLECPPSLIEELGDAHENAVNMHEYVKERLALESDDLEASRPKITSIPFDRSEILLLEEEIGLLNLHVASLEKIELGRQSQVQSKISDLRIMISDMETKEKERQSQVQHQISLAMIQIAQLQNREESRQALIQSSLSSNKIEQIKASTLVRDGDRAKAEATQLAQELHKIRSSLCPTCENTWVNNAAKVKESDILEKLKEYKKIVIIGMAAVSQLVVLEEERNQLLLDKAPKSIPEIDTLNDEIAQLRLDAQPKLGPETEELKFQVINLHLEAHPQVVPESIELKMKIGHINTGLITERNKEKDHQLTENSKQQAILVEFNKRQTELRRKHEIALNLVRDEESRTLSKLESAKGKARSFEEAKVRFDTSFNKLNKQLNDYEEKVKDKAAQLALVLEEIELANEAKKAVKSYLSCSFEDALDSIGDAATNMIRNIPNMANATVQFEGLRETASGKIKEEIVCSISVDGEQAVPIKSLSGGERSSLDLAVDLSVIQFIEERTGMGCDIFCIDEGFTGLDTQCCENAIEMLKNCSTGKKILLIDHNPVIAQSIESKITVKRDGQTSVVVQ